MKFVAYLSHLFVPAKSLSKRAFQSIFWALAMPFTTRLFGFLRTIILARILLPKDFGIFGIVSVIFATLDTFTSFGFEEAIIQKKGEIKPYLHNAWTLQVFKNLFVSIILLGIAPYAGHFFNEPQITLIIPFVSLVLIFRGFTNIGIVYFQKELEFHRRFIYSNLGALTDVVASICFALKIRNYWALALGWGASQIVLLVVSYLLHSFRPQFRFSITLTKDLLKYGIWIWGLGVISFFALRADKFIIGKILDLTQLGYYLIATRFADLVAINVGRVFGTVMFPVYSKIQDDIDKLKSGFLTNFEMLVFITLPLTIIIAALASEIITILLGQQWLNSVKVLQILTIAAFIRALMTPSSSLLKGIGKPNVEFFLTSLRAAIAFFSAIPFTYFYGIEGTAFALLLSVCATYPFWLYLSLKLTKIHIKEILQKANPSIIGAIIMMICVIFIKKQIVVNDLVGLSLIICGLLIIFISPSLVLWKISRTGPVLRAINLLRKT